MPNWSLVGFNLQPHGYCLSWQPHLLWLHAGADLVTAIAYYTIPAMLLVFVRRRRDLQFSWMFVLFGIFIMACGATHVMSLWNLWVPDYLTSGIVKAVTAIASVGTAIALYPLIPKALALPGPAQWEAVHNTLRQEIRERREAETEVRRLNGELERRLCELQAAQSELLSTARQAGMAEVATNVLHNVGNVLNSVNVSVGVLSRQVRGSKVSGLTKAAELLNEHAADLGDFLTRDEKGKRLPDYLNKLTEALSAEQRSLLDEFEQLSKSVDHIKDIVATQQSYAGTARVVAPAQIRDLIEDALRMNAGALTRHEVTVVRDFVPVPLLPLDRHRVLQILVNLISNAKQAMDGRSGHAHRMTLGVALAECAKCAECSQRADCAARHCLVIRVADEGEGIAAENLARIFNHGFTTRPNGHGFGLHSCALAAREMGGSLRAESDGPGRGAVFTLELPIKAEETP